MLSGCGEGRGGRVRAHCRAPAEPPGALAAQQRPPDRGRLFLPLGTGGRSSPGRASEATRRVPGRRPQGPRGRASSIPRPRTARPGQQRRVPAAPPGPAPKARGGRHPEGGTRRAGDLGERPRLPPPSLGCASFPARAGRARCWTGNRQETLLAGQGLREAGAEPRARTHPQPAGWTWILRTSQQSPTSSNSVTSPASFSSGVTQKSVVEVHNWWVVNLVSQMSSKSFKRKQFR